MHLLTISLYEFGQFLRILLWISLPIAIIAMLITTYLHYRRKGNTAGELVLSVEGYDPPDNVEVLTAGRQSRLHSSTPPDGEVGGTAAGMQGGDEENENMYRGILWMKEKFEQYRDLADQRYDQLKEQLASTEKKYQDLLEAREVPSTTAGEVSSTADPITEDDSLHEQMEKKNKQIGELQVQLGIQNQKVDELVARLQSSSQQLLAIYQELDKSLQ